MGGSHALARSGRRQHARGAREEHRRRLAATAFLQAYLEAARGAVFMPADLSEIRRPLELFTLEKALYELHYEMNNRPEWVSTPLTAILQILESGARS